MTPAWQPGLAPVPSSLVRVIEELVPDGLWERIAPLLAPAQATSLPASGSAAGR